MTKHDNTDKDLAGAERSGHSVDPKEAHRGNQNPWYSMGRRYDYDEAMESFPFSLVSPSTKSKADTSQDTLDDTSEVKNRPLHECDDMDKSRTEKERYDGTVHPRRRERVVVFACAWAAFLAVVARKKNDLLLKWSLLNLFYFMNDQCRQKYGL